MQPKNKIAKNFLYLAIFITVVVVTWIAGSVYNALYKSTIPQDTSAYSMPITPAFDMDTLNSLNKRKSVRVDFSSNISPYLGNSGGSESATLTPPESDIPEVSVTPSPDDVSQSSESAQPIVVTPTNIPVTEP